MVLHAGGVNHVLCSTHAGEPAEERATALAGVRASSLRQEDLPGLDWDEPTPGVETRVCHVCVEREGGSLGITLRGGSHPDPALSSPLVVTHVRPGGPADREGSIQAGDRLVSVDGVSVRAAPLPAAHALLHRAGAALLGVEYEVAVREEVATATGPLLVQLAMPRGRPLGVVLAAGAGNIVVIESVRPASIADRCGALHAGDVLLAINQERLDAATAADADRILQEAADGGENTLSLHVLPRACVTAGSPSPSTQSTLSVRRRAASPVECWDGDTCAVSHAETLTVRLHVRCEGGCGLSVRDGVSTPTSGVVVVVVAAVATGGPADTCGCVHVGDRVLAVDGVSLPSAAHVATALREVTPGTHVSLHVEFDVADSVVPASGVFTVRLAKRGASLGITVTARPPAPVTISHIRRGSVAHRTGSLTVGDTIMAINGCCLTAGGLPDTERILGGAQRGDVVTLTVCKGAAGPPAPPPLPSPPYPPHLPSVDSAVESWDSSPPASHPSVRLYQAESATVKRLHKCSLGIDPQLSQSSHSVDSGQSGVLSEEDRGDDSDVEGDLSQCVCHESSHAPHYYSPSVSPLPLAQYLHCRGTTGHHRYGHCDGTGSSTSHMQLYQVTLHKDPVYEDFGFSVSDGLYHRGVYINRIRRGGPAGGSGGLRPFDRILQVNDTRTHDFDCCLTVPLIASAGERLDLLVGRVRAEPALPWLDEEEDSPLPACTATMTKTL